jgi:hypothetical protein
MVFLGIGLFMHSDGVDWHFGMVRALCELAFHFMVIQGSGVAQGRPDVSGR